MIHIIITSYNEPLSTERAINKLLAQKIEQKYKIIILDPFEEVKRFIEEKFKDKKQVEFELDEGLGKSFALNTLFRKIYSNNSNDIIILTDGDVFVDPSVVNEIVNGFNNKKVGVICGHPISLNSRSTKYGFWAALQFEVLNKLRKNLNTEGFMETSGYLFAIRNGTLKGFPVDSSEDSIIPYLFYQKGYLIKYLEDAIVYVKNPTNWSDWINQRKRNIKGHSTINKNIKGLKDIRRTKTMFNEIKYGLLFSLTYPKNIKEIFWLFQFYLARFYVWTLAFYEIKFKKKRYQDGWRESEIKSTRTLD